MTQLDLLIETAITVCGACRRPFYERPIMIWQSPTCPACRDLLFEHRKGGMRNVRRV